MTDWAREKSPPLKLPFQGPAAGTKWKFNSARVEFKKNGDAVMGSRTGRWSQNDNVVRWSVKGLYGYTYHYAGELDGNVMKTYVSAGESEDFKLWKKVDFIEGTRVYD